MFHRPYSFKRLRTPFAPFADAIAAALLTGLAGCMTVGPNYAGAPPVAAAASAAFARQGAAQASAPLATWWTTLNDPLLDSLMQRALQASPELNVAEARLRQSRAGLANERANQAPKGSASALATRARIPPISLDGSSGSGGSASWINLFSVGFDATWEIDLFGGQRRKLEAAQAQLDGAQAQLADVQVSLTAEVAQAYVQLRDCQARLRLSRDAIARQERMLELTMQRFGAGTASRLDVTRLQGQLENTRADVAPLNAQVSAYEDQLAILLGQAPGSLDTELAQERAVPLPPARVEVGDPTALLQRRPDIRAAERALAASNAQIGVAEAARFPRLQLLGLIGVGGTRSNDLLHLDDASFVAAPQLSWNVLDFGRSLAQVRQAEARRDEADAQYRAKVLAALGDAEDALARFGQRRMAVATLARAKAMAEETTALMRQRQEAGTASTIELLDAERQQIAAEQNLSAGLAALAGDYVSLQKALGLGWQAVASAG